MSILSTIYSVTESVDNVDDSESEMLTSNGTECPIEEETDSMKKSAVSNDGRIGGSEEKENVLSVTTGFVLSLSLCLSVADALRQNTISFFSPNIHCYPLHRVQCHRQSRKSGE